MLITTPAPTIALEIGELRPALFFNGRHWKEASQLEGNDKKLFASIARMEPDTERPSTCLPTFRADYGIAGNRRVALLQQKTTGSDFQKAIEDSGLPATVRQAWERMKGDTRR